MDSDDDDHIPLLPTDPAAQSESGVSRPSFLHSTPQVSPDSNSDSLTFSVPISTSHQQADSNFGRKSQQRAPQFDSSTSHLKVDVLILRNALRRFGGWFFTATKIRFILVLFAIFFCIYLFVNTDLAAEPEYVSVSKEHPYHWEVTHKNPEVLEVLIFTPEPEDN